MNSQTFLTHQTHPSTSSYVIQPPDCLNYDGFLNFFQHPFPCLSTDSDALFGLKISCEHEKQSWAQLVRDVPLLDLSLYQIERRTQRLTGCDWKIFMEIYFDDYHVEPFHPGLSSWADCDQLSWIFENFAQVQLVKSSVLSGTRSSSYETLANLSRSLFVQPPAFAAAWAAIYPGTMIEWLAGGLAISTVRPVKAGESLNEVVFAYPKGWLDTCPEFAQAHQDAYWETAKEDDEISQRMQQGKNILIARGDDERGPAHSHLEAGIVAFHDWLAHQVEKK